MIQEEIKSLLSKLINQNHLSSNFLSKFSSENANQLELLKKNSSVSSRILGIYFLYLFTDFMNQKSKLSIKLDEEIQFYVEKFNNGSISSEEAKKKLEELVSKNLTLKTNLEYLPIQKNLLPFSIDKTTIDIEKMFSNLEKAIMTSNSIKQVFLRYFNEFESNKEHILSFSNIQLIKSKEFSDFLTSLSQKSESNDELVDITALDEKFTEKLIDLFENFFLKFREKEISPINFHIHMEQTLGEKNDLTYFFKEEEFSNFTSEVRNQSYFPQLEMNSKVKKPIFNSSLQEQEEIWETVGSIVVNPVKIGIGIAEYPYLDKKAPNELYISVRVEKEVDLSDSDNLYHEIQSLRISQISDRTDSRRNLIISEISESLEIPPELALYPTIVEEYLTRNKSVSIEFSIQKTKLRTEFYLFKKVNFDRLNGIITIPDDLEPINHASDFQLVPAKKLNFVENKIVILANEKSIGKSSNEFCLQDCWYLTIELDFPIQSVIDKISIKIRKSDDSKETDLWKLHFTISKALDIFEAEALLISNIWKYIWREKIPVSPFDLQSAFLAYVPSGAINKETITNESIQLSRGIEQKSIDEITNNLPYTIISEQKLTIGKAISIILDPNDKQMYLIYCNITEIDILKKLNRDYSQNSLVKLGKRVSKALALATDKLDILLHPRYLLTYALFYSIQFDVQINFNNFYEVINWLMVEFEMKRIPISNIKDIDKNNLLIEVVN